MNQMLLPVTTVTGIGEVKAQALAELGIETVHDLLFYFPSRYEDYSIRELSEVANGERITIRGEVYAEPAVRFFGKRRSRMMVRLVVDRAVVTAIWFNQHYLKNRIKIGQEIQVSGKWEKNRMQVTVSETKTTIPKTTQQQSEEVKIKPIYPASAAVTVKQIQRYLQQALQQYASDIEEILPAEIRERRLFISRREAITAIHFPTSTALGIEARKRLAYEELFFYQLKMQALQLVQKRNNQGLAMPIPLEPVRAFVRALPFRLTNAQKRALKEILDDLQADFGMNRLLQGDVGSGKTIVAAVALYAATQAGCQGALMAPTEILAEQHAATLTKLLAPYGLQVGLLTGGMSAPIRRELLGGLQMGLIDIVVGTHALIQDDVHFSKLGLVITDEQHRFGVEQRRVLREKGLQPNVLCMTATPIPRTLAISVFADMDVSTLDELPAGRKPIETYWVKENMFERVLAFIAKEVNNGRQAYVICPLIEESEKIDVQNALDVHAQLVHYFGEQSQVGLLHGRMTSKEKEQVMREFSANQIQVLVSTTVIEVGVDVPNATVMVVYDAERFGLAQLHQLRGRVGRGSEQSTCILIADPKTEVGRERMRIMKETCDGFEVARRDLALRGPGDFFGTKQSGLPEFRLADLTQDFEQLELARADAAAILRTEDFWTDDNYAFLRAYLEQQGILEQYMLD
ncbi:ATP-dependent DNA helicase RecG [Ammoniphilus oxalaticus]|uniref:ATP-dependent DNA helicase RecG n=1 Tax=Ammoniphilus oxalaticus TaxID=66863 RepID=A0A419SJJ7_9BACL|nr:ATP-dependent DNA helicase RecG [Ammoniphilus oxalaticus]RKD24157.1 ATP-dependent DNA helicase RecG [Ammoniphilus oxalaticus]